MTGGPGALLEAFRQGLRDLGRVEGQHVMLEPRFAQGALDRLPPLAAELVQLKVDVIYAFSTLAAVAAREATSTIPIVFAGVSDPVGTSLVASLARPGGNLTGLSHINVELGAKRLELLKEAVPTVSRVAILFNPADPSNTLQVPELQGAARALGVTLHPLGVRGANEFEPAFAAMLQERAEALLTLGGPLTAAHAKRIVDFTAMHRLPAMYGLRSFVEVGGLMSYAANLVEQSRRAASYVDKVLKGGTPADLPVERPTQFELVLNLKTAKALEITFPPTLLILADEVIQ